MDHEHIEYYSKLMEEIKRRALTKFECISKNEDTQFKFAKLLLEARYESCENAEYFLESFGITELETAAIYDDIDCFTEIYLADRELDYVTTMYDMED